MENMRRSIKLFFATYGSLLFRIIGVIAIIIFILQGINYLYKENSQNNLKENSISNRAMMEKQEKLKNEKEDKILISKFLDYCNDKRVEEAYNILSEECIKENYQTLEKFSKEYVAEIFTYKKDYEIELENDLYKITIIDGILESGSVENRKSIVCYCRVEENVLERTIYIER